ncbi:MAG: type II toxin-antitoxin system prevent-host-death family antitoxin [Bifidobacteriaceae bacterium]|nr:type II toxin-antitoxin system prevent-host-death family antitoxin [Bifidobacteriaceae bacterium]
MAIVELPQPLDRIGLREFRANLSECLERVQAGHCFTLTEHGRPVARLVPLEEQSAYERLVAAGVIRPASRGAGALEPPVEVNATVSDLVARQRR